MSSTANLFPFGTALLLSLVAPTASAAGIERSTPQTPVARAFVDAAPLEALSRAREIGEAPREQSMTVAVSLRVRDEELQAFADRVSDPRSPDYRRFLTPEEVGERFGPARSDVDAIAAHLATNGLDVTLVARNRLGVVARGPVQAVERAFGVRVRSYALERRAAHEPALFVAPDVAPTLPAELAPLVLDVCGLDTYVRAKPLVTLLTPALARGLYGAASLFAGGVAGSGRTIGVSNFDGFRQADYLAYLAQFALPVPPGGAGSNVTVVPCAGGGSGAGPTHLEGDLDIQMVLGVAPLADVRVYDSPPGFNLLAVLTQESSDDACDVITESWTWNLNASLLGACHNQHLAMTAQGITYVAASGDTGTTHAPFGYPGFDPEVLMVGGTIADASAPTGLRATEVGWFGSGGGWSTNLAVFNVRPPWQVGAGVPPITAQNDKRLIPDVSVHAAGSGTGAYPFYSAGLLRQGNTGTSFASPVFAAELALVEERMILDGALPPDAQGRRRLGRVQDLIYAQNGRPDVWFDVTSGANGNLPDGTPSTCNAGWDPVTGWGPMNVGVFASILGCPAGGTCGGASEGFCFGDDSGAPCPCDNVGLAGRGCASSTFADGALLTLGGSSIVSNDSAVLEANDVAGRVCVFQQASAMSAPMPLDDGLACLGGTIVRVGTKLVVGAAARYPEAGDPAIHARGAVPVLGGTFYYQATYRNASAAFCTPATSNRTNGVAVTWSM